MLYDPKWQKKPDVHSVAGLIAWLETQDPQQRYVYSSPGACLCAQYYRAMGYRFVLVTPESFCHGFLWSHVLPDGFNQIAVYGEPTFGAALQRAREYAG
jgi:hypothetical protein